MLIRLCRYDVLVELVPGQRGQKWAEGEVGREQERIEVSKHNKALCYFTKNLNFLTMLV